MTKQSRILDRQRVLIVGGGGGGIGRAITRAAASAGAAGIAVVGSNQERTEEATSGLECPAVAIVGNVRAGGFAGQALADMASRLGGIDVLITVVGGSSAFAPRALIHETKDEDWDLIFDVNLGYVFRFVRAALPYFLEQRRGAIVSVGSIAGDRSSSHACAYGAAKAGLVNLGRTVAVEYADKGIRMNVINSGMVVTPRLIEAFGSSAPPSAGAIPMGRAGSPEEIANIVTFFASPLSAYATGQVFNVDGGLTAVLPVPVGSPTAPSVLSGT